MLIKNILTNSEAILNEIKMISGNTMCCNFSQTISNSFYSWYKENVTQDMLEQKVISFNYLDIKLSKLSLSHHYLSDKAFLNVNYSAELYFEVLFSI